MSLGLISFSTIVDEVFSQESKTLCISFGELPVEKLKTEMEEMSQNQLAILNTMPYRIFEYHDDMVFVEKELPKDFNKLIQGRFFGDAGDLMIFCDGRNAYWRLICENDGSSCTAFVNDFFKIRTSTLTEGLHWADECYCCWGQREKEKYEEHWVWSEDRIGKKISYPWQIMHYHPPERMTLLARHYFDKGQMRFVRIIGWGPEK